MVQSQKADVDMTAEAFVRWSSTRQASLRYELLDGIVHEMHAERLIHARIKARIAFAFQRQIAERGLPCEALGDGMAVKVDDATVFEPDALVRCGLSLPDDTLLLIDPLIVVEVASPSSQRVDVLVKFTRYFRNASIVHYLIIIANERVVIHHRRTADGRIEGEGHETGTVVLDPPGLHLTWAKFSVECTSC